MRYKPIVMIAVLVLFLISIRMYEGSNSGSWYDLGFLLGAGAFLGGGGAGSCKKKKKF